MKSSRSSTPKTLSEALNGSKKGYLSISRILKVSRAVVDLLETYHSDSKFHGELTSDSILLHRDQVYLCDFAAQTYVPGKESIFYSSVRYPDYAPPEVLAKLPCEGPEIDVWSLGV